MDPAEVSAQLAAQGRRWLEEAEREHDLRSRRLGQAGRRWLAPEDEVDEPDAHLARIARSFTAIRRSSGRVPLSTAAGMPASDEPALRALDVVDELGYAAMIDVAQRLHLSRAQASRLVAQLVARGWAERETDAWDARVASVSVTLEGREVLDRLDDAARVEVELGTLCWSPDDLRSLARLLGRFVEARRDHI